MGRFGNVMLVAGEPELELTAKRGEVVRLYLTNTANTRVFNITLPEARMKLVGADSGHYEHEEFVEEVLVAPSERVVIDVLFGEPGELALEHKTPDRTYRLAAITVTDEPAEPTLVDQYEALRTSPDLVAERERIAPCSALRRTRRWPLLPRWTWGSGRRDARLRVSDASRGGQRRAGQVPEVWDETLQDSGPAEAAGQEHHGHGDHRHGQGREWRERRA